MSRVVHFEIHSQDPESCQRFYSTLFGWTFSKWDGPMDYWTITTGPQESPGIDGGMVMRRGPAAEPGQPVNAYVCTIGVEDLDGVVGKCVQYGGEIAVPKMPIPTIGWLAYLKDPDGNIFGIMQNDPTAQ